MANWSAFTIGGLDPIATNWERKNARKDAEANQDMQVKYDIWRAKTLPHLQLEQANNDYWLEQNLAYQRTVDSVKNQRAALEAAGYNPLLAIGGAGAGIGAAPGSGMQPLVASNSASKISTSFSGGSSGVGGNPYDIANARQELENKQKSNQLLDAQIKQISAQVRHLNATTAQTEKETEYIGSSNFTKMMQSIYDAKVRDKDDFSPDPRAKEGSIGDMLYQFKTYLNDKLDGLELDSWRCTLPKFDSNKSPEAKKRKEESLQKVWNQTMQDLWKNFNLNF